MMNDEGRTTAVYSAKGGAGCSTIAALIALRGRARTGRRPRLVDMGGDQPGVLGSPEPDAPGLADWLATDDADCEALRRLERPVGADLTVLHRGAGAMADHEGRLAAAVRSWRDDCCDTVIDAGDAMHRCGHNDLEARRAAVTAADRRLLVTRNCFLALRRAASLPDELRPHGIVILKEIGRPLVNGDAEDVIGAPVALAVDVEPSVARSVDAGLLAARVPVALDRALRALRLPDPVES